MTQAQTEQEPLGVDDNAISEILERKNKNLDELNEEETYVIKSLNNGQITDAYDGTLNFSTEEGKAEFNVLQKLISKNNWLVIPAAIFSKFENKDIDLKELESATSKNHEKLGLNAPNFTLVAPEPVNNDFISNVSDVQATPEVKSLTQEPAPKTGIAAGEAVARKPSDIINSFDTSVKNKINELSYQRSRIENTKGKVSIKTLLLAGGVFVAGSLFTPIAAITIPTAIAIGGFAVVKGLFGKNPDIKNYDKQIELLKEATANMVLKRTGEDSKENVTNFIKHNKGLNGTLFDEKIEAEFARLCRKNNVKIDRTVFKDAYKYENGHVLDYNREVRKAKM